MLFNSLAFLLFLPTVFAADYPELRRLLLAAVADMSNILSARERNP